MPLIALKGGLPMLASSWRLSSLISSVSASRRSLRTRSKVRSTDFLTISRAVSMALVREFDSLCAKAVSRLASTWVTPYLPDTLTPAFTESRAGSSPASPRAARSARCFAESFSVSLGGRLRFVDLLGPRKPVVFAQLGFARQDVLDMGDLAGFVADQGFARDDQLAPADRRDDRRRGARCRSALGDGKSAAHAFLDRTDLGADLVGLVQEDAHVQPVDQVVDIEEIAVGKLGDHALEQPRLPLRKPLLDRPDHRLVDDDGAGRCGCAARGAAAPAPRGPWLPPCCSPWLPARAALAASPSARRA
ncbi:MAG: hypothetical protein IPH09_12430 [bacterium]|nr:hypothetical protein [bacterium]